MPKDFLKDIRKSQIFFYLMHPENGSGEKSNLALTCSHIGHQIGFKDYKIISRKIFMEEAKRNPEVDYLESEKDFLQPVLDEIYNAIF